MIPVNGQEGPADVCVMEMGGTFGIRKFLIPVYHVIVGWYYMQSISNLHESHYTTMLMFIYYSARFFFPS
jgi:hypothetical protein